jgi:SHS2 domain-containing protein
MEHFRILEHTADVGFEAGGATREEVFANSARALFHLIVDLETIAPRREISLSVDGSDPAALLVNWLSELLYLHDAEGWLFSEFAVHLRGEKFLAATARGEMFDTTRHQAKMMVKAITYHQLSLQRTAEGWRAQVYVDI